MSCFVLISVDDEPVNRAVNTDSDVIITRNSDASTSVTVSPQPVKGNMFTIQLTIYVLCITLGVFGMYVVCIITSVLFVRQLRHRELALPQSLKLTYMNEKTSVNPIYETVDVNLICPSANQYKEETVTAMEMCGPRAENFPNDKVAETGLKDNGIVENTTKDHIGQDLANIGLASHNSPADVVLPHCSNTESPGIYDDFVYPSF